jgi:hypothetical protein
MVLGNAGLTKREFIAALALQGILACPDKGSLEEAAQAAVMCADALLEKLNAEELNATPQDEEHWFNKV